MITLMKIKMGCGSGGRSTCCLYQVALGQKKVNKGGGHWSVKYGHNNGLEYLGNQWGAPPSGYGVRLKKGDEVTIVADMDKNELSFKTNGADQGKMGSFAGKGEV